MDDQIQMIHPDDLFSIIYTSGGFLSDANLARRGATYQRVPEKVKTLILFGATADKIEAATKASPSYSQGNPVIIRVENMEQAVQTAESCCRTL